MKNKFDALYEEILKGGKADGMTLQEIADKHKVSLAVMQDAFDKGLKVEMEHTSDEATASEVVRDHLEEMGEKYYYALDKMESSLKKKN